jgi:hypothetical protein
VGDCALCFSLGLVPVTIIELSKLVRRVTRRFGPGSLAESHALEH